MVQKAMQYIDETPDLDTRIELIKTLNSVSAGKVYLYIFCISAYFVISYCILVLYQVQESNIFLSVCGVYKGKPIKYNEPVFSRFLSDIRRNRAGTAYQKTSKDKGGTGTYI